MKAILAISALAACAASAQAGFAVLEPGTYLLGNHPDGNAAPPTYGLRLDGLDGSGGGTIFTFDFEHPDSEMLMTVTGSSITISGDAYGGRDTGSGYAMDANLGVYSIEFTYNLDVTIGPDDIIADNIGSGMSEMRDTGSITTPGGDVIDLAAQRAGGRTFEISSDHRGFDGLSGFGWVNHGDDPTAHISASDWLFTIAETPIPTPGAIALAGVGIAFGARRNRNKA